MSRNDAHNNDVRKANETTARILASTHNNDDNNDNNDDVSRVVVYLADIARECHKSPKSVRARFRRLYETRDNRTSRQSDVRDVRHLPRVIDRKRWAFSIDDAERVREIVINDTRIIDDDATTERAA